MPLMFWQCGAAEVKRIGRPVRSASALACSQVANHWMPACVAAFALLSEAFVSPAEAGAPGKRTAVARTAAARFTVTA